MKIVFSEHAKTTLRERKIPKSQITQTVTHPQQVKSSFRNRRLMQRTFGDKILEVVTVVEEDAIIVITQYYVGVNDEIQVRSRN